MNKVERRFLFFVTKPYSIPIIEPIDKIINQCNDYQSRWYMASKAKEYESPGQQLNNNNDVMNYKPDTIIVPGNIVPHFWPGLKVQIFHGLDDEVKGFYNVTGFFDLYCTPGPTMTNTFSEIAKRKKSFFVKETGWSKLDPLFKNNIEFIDQKNKMTEKYKFNRNLPIILYAPTFPPKYTSAPDLVEEINKLKAHYNWIIKFHPLMNKTTISIYKKLEDNHLKISDDLNIIPIMSFVDIMVTDTSSVAYEFLSFDKPLITYKALDRKDKGIDILKPDQLHDAINRSLEYPNEFSINRKKYLNAIHPYNDGKSSDRVLEEIESILKGDFKKELKWQPKNIFRKYSVRKMIN